MINAEAEIDAELGDVDDAADADLYGDLYAEGGEGETLLRSQIVEVHWKNTSLGVFDVFLLGTVED